jgi:glutamyl-tRNA synthetase/nondiscriminating glutamyl-tRNA synthetase
MTMEGIHTMSKVRVRFAPSPTGYVHVGNARTALFNWLFARHNGGAYVLRIEDTDVERSKEEYEQQLLEDLRWFGIDWDEGPDKGGAFAPYRQSERKEAYRRFATQLIDQGHAFFCFCTAEQLEQERQEALKAGLQPRYSGRCRKRSREEAARKVAAGEPAAIRLKIVESAFSWNDLVHGPTSFSAQVIGDPILVRSDGNPAYNYAVVIDDHLMEITHVIRGDDHISNTPRQLAVYHALGWEPPQFAHLSTILGSDRTRLSKRHGATSLESFRKMGILPEALRNYLALLGWSPADGKTEILTPEELIEQFSLDQITKSPAVFDNDKLYSFNRHYIKLRFNVQADRAIDIGALEDEDLARVTGLSVDVVKEISHLAEMTAKAPPAVQIAVWAWGYFTKAGYLPQTGMDETTMRWFVNLIRLLAPSVDRLEQLPERASLIFSYDAGAAVTGEETRHVVEDAGARKVLKAFIPKVMAETTLTYERFREIAKAVQRETGKKGKDLFHPIRVAITGAVSGPELEKLIPIFEEGSKLPLARHVKSVAERLREFVEAARL